MRLLGLDLGGRQIRNALTQQDFNGADLRDREFDLAHGAGPADIGARITRFQRGAPEACGVQAEAPAGQSLAAAAEAARRIWPKPASVRILSFRESTIVILTSEGYLAARAPRA